MQDTLTSGPVLTKTVELCDTIVRDPAFQSLKANIETFLADETAKELYRTVAEKGEYLHHKQHQGVQLGDDEIAEYEQHREALLGNPVARAFLDAQEGIRSVQDTVTRYVTKTIEIGRVPTEADFATCGSGCSCHH
ncbi:MAG: YlbF family regulator [Verrucomicrobia bacterium]|nr:YlbF family regulator [Verrucomicrobiales bacterium]MCZ7641267.1 YlbF family regulator [Verrucomicrobiota bacterium]